MQRNHTSTITEIKNIRDILNQIQYNSWILLDLDNTVMESIVELGSDQWFGKLIEYAAQVIPDKSEAIELVIAIYTEVQHHIKTKAVEQEIALLIKTLQDIGFPVIGITARDHSLINTTFRQLHENNINFARTRSAHEYHIVLNLSDNKSVYHNGIIFCSGNDKGTCLKEFLSICDKHPEHIVMVDDKEKHLLHVKNFVESLHIGFHGLRYGFLDVKATQVDMQAAHIQLAHIKNHLPSPIQNHIDKLKIETDHVALNPDHYAALFAKPGDKRALACANLSETKSETKKGLARRCFSPTSSLTSSSSIFASNRRKVEPNIKTEFAECKYK